ncbi:nuclear transport factor 2 family protein [Leucobacter luti]|uniref:Uncharacterized protein DUF4440 n=1 Tax=Leucobacter luti TaxID=340320 RepID=A0A4Q7U077_9MICO|nr:nuclear transport factor 2 family protein [Leucobacter luti]MBL3699292.1 nuclear transport factor 2 family protein [Leucobacter luti]RZT66801.1 uncharacterized protein DUF4440 [Leucobacter luti]
MSEQSSDNVGALAERLRGVERARLRALVAADIAAAEALHSDEFQLITPIGARLDRAQYLGAVAAGQIDYLHWEAGDIEVRVAGDAATLRYRAELEVAFGGHHVARSDYWHTDTYERSGSEWRAVWSQATQIQ